MLRNIFLSLLSVGMVGCVGVKTYTEETYSKSYFKPITLSELTASHNDLIPSEDGKSLKYLDKDNEWCGSVIYAVILPIPLMAPVCERSSEFEVKDGVVIEKLETSIQKGGKVCGPLQFLLNGMMSFGQGSQGWCS
jgi:hypothetical protein